MRRVEGVILLTDSISGSHTHITHIYGCTGKKYTYAQKKNNKKEIILLGGLNIAIGLRINVTLNNLIRGFYCKITSLVCFSVSHCSDLFSVHLEVWGNAALL